MTTKDSEILLEPAQTSYFGETQRRFTAKHPHFEGLLRERVSRDEHPLALLFIDHTNTAYALESVGGYASVRDQIEDDESAVQLVEQGIQQHLDEVNRG